MFEQLILISLGTFYDIPGQHSTSQQQTLLVLKLMRCQIQIIFGPSVTYAHTKKLTQNLTYLHSDQSLNVFSNTHKKTHSKFDILALRSKSECFL